MNSNDVIEILQQMVEIDPDSYDGSYELMREAVGCYVNVDRDLLDYHDLDMIYMMAVGSWRSGIENKKTLVRASHISDTSKVHMQSTLDSVWQNAKNRVYSNRESGQDSVGMFGTGYHTTRTKTDKKSTAAFVCLLVDILKDTDDEVMFDKAEKVFSSQFKGFAAASASVILHCLKPYTFPIINSNMGHGNIFSTLGLKIKSPSNIGSYIFNCRIIKRFRDENLSYKNYRVLDIAAWDSNGTESEISRIIEQYKKNFIEINKGELYKWQAVKTFQDNWDIESNDFVNMLSTSLEKSMDLLSSTNYSPKAMIIKYATSEPEIVRSMFRNLFDESVPIVARVESFIQSADDLTKKLMTGTRTHYQDLHAISTYLAFRYPDKHYLYKRSIFEDFAKTIGYANIPRRGHNKSLEAYYEMCNIVLAAVKNDNDLLELSRSRDKDDCFADSELHLLTHDIIVFGSRQYSDEWWPRIDDYTPGISTEQWSELLKDNTVFTSDSLLIVKRMLKFGGGVTCTQLSKAYGETKNFYNMGSSTLAKRVYNKTQCLILTSDNENAKWWPILYQGKKAEKSMDGSYLWRLRPELSEALMSIGEISPPVQPRGYWWLNVNAKIWSIRSIRVGEEHSYNLVNENGNKRKIYKNFIDAQADDPVIYYETFPAKQIVALGKISRTNDGIKLYFEKTENLTNPIEYNSLKDIADLQQSEYFINPQGSLFKFTEAEYGIILDTIREQNPIIVAPEYDVYTKGDFLSEVFIDEIQYDRLASLLERKKNIIIQGAPGVGKTFAAKRLAYSIIGAKNENNIEFIQFHQNYSYEDFIMGYKPQDEGFELKNGVFYRFCQQAENNPDDRFFFIIDEINRGNISKIFGELLMLIESDYRGTKTTLAYNGLLFSVPPNLYIIGMMNTADRSLALIDYALRRRFCFFEMIPAFDSDGFRQYQQKINSDTFNECIDVIDSLNKEISADESLGVGFRIGHSYFCNQEECTDEWLYEVIEYELIPMLSEYWFDDVAKVEKWTNALHGVLHD